MKIIFSIYLIIVIQASALIEKYTKLFVNKAFTGAGTHFPDEP
jgi:hypothetical protein